MKNTTLRFVLIVGLLAGVNWLASQFFFRLDLTEDKRYSISDATKALLGNLDKDVIVNVYLSGDLPAGFERLEAATRETLDEFKTYANGHLIVNYSDPSEATSEEQRQKQFLNLADRGLTPTNIFDNEDGKRTEKIVFPGAIVQADTLSVPVQLLKGNRSATPEEQLNQSYEGVEFEIASAIRLLGNQEHKKVGLVVSHTKISPARLSDLIATIQQNYDVFLDMNNPESYAGLDALLILKPDSAFSEDEKFKLDQYIMGGGNALFFVDGARVDSVSLDGNYAQPLDLNLSDLFFKWGARVNTNLVKDLKSSAEILLNVGNLGDKPDIRPVPWRFFPLLNNFGKHTITRNVNSVYTRFLSSIDTVGGADNIKKTPLLMTSENTQILNAPVLVGYNEARNDPDPATYTGGPKLAGVLLEGSFTSLFANRILPGDPRAAKFKLTGSPAKVIICSDGDIIVNDYDYKRNAPLPLGYDRVTRQTFGNKDFVMHALDYMTDANGLINARSKQIDIRALDKIQIREDKKFWQALNLLLPIALIGVFGGLRYYLRGRKFA
ncbi:gliding motility-associated ABC transporter substrate-binding protein GldG [Dyadobacter sp. LJ53]|uniref:gliding motility-associated ABC transporter substrate-binding protein GldG n=1 Tax=Dyadobacter chenwenxiniae TaxID=2906456 RepID=UPI001F217339|nr:gliding motility-associated ABC transporter substrate-binding protein GldG [Dyadobacter chenwenxiniae]MCF0051390.1 gliding motility-associated ABC transporter substrate-binding protein GldG [Dyadobacter chenwenxiniae]